MQLLHERNKTSRILMMYYCTQHWKHDRFPGDFFPLFRGCSNIVFERMCFNVSHRRISLPDPPAKEVRLHRLRAISFFSLEF